MRLSMITVLCCLLGGCGIQNVQIYDGPQRGTDEHSILSSLNLYVPLRLSLQVTAIDGKKVNTSNAASFYMLPGTHRVTVRALRDLKLGSAPGSINFKEATLEGTLTTEAGHTYIPSAVLDGETIGLVFENKGVGYPQECLPLYKAINEGGPLVRKDGRKCKI